MTMGTEPTGLFTGKQTFQVTEKIQTYYKIIELIRTYQLLT